MCADAVEAIKLQCGTEHGSDSEPSVTQLHTLSSEELTASGPDLFQWWF